MSEKDTLTKDYIQRPDIFADAFNHFLYDGKTVLKADSLSELNSAELAVLFGADFKGVPEERFRDVLKMCTMMTDGKTAYCIMGIENQSEIHYAMPVKNGLYDMLQLAHQVKQIAAMHREDRKKGKGKGKRESSAEFLSGLYKEDRLIPVITLAIYFGADEWDAPIRLRDMYDCTDEKILSLAADYKVNLIAPFYMDDEQLKGFHSSLRQVLTYIKYSKDKDQLRKHLQEDEHFLKLERDAVDVINIMTDSKIKFVEDKEEPNVCQAIIDIREEGRIEGRLEGIEEERANTLKAEQEAEQARQEAELARQEAEQARKEAEQLRQEAEQARRDAEQARREVESLRRESVE